MGNIPKGGDIGLTAITGGSALAGTSPFFGASATFPALRESRRGFLGGGRRQGAKRPEKLRPEALLPASAFCLAGRGAEGPPAAKRRRPPGAAASFSIPGDTVSPGMESRRFPGLFPILGREGG